MKSNPHYEERVASIWTEALFTGFATIFLALLLWRVGISDLGILSLAFLCLFIFFLFYAMNYRTLNISITLSSLILRFGIFSWRIPLNNIAECRHDHLPLLMWYGGAGIHYMFIRGRYRASFNFLEHPRVVVTLKRKTGLVQDVSFSTRQPDEVLQFIQDAISMSQVAEPQL